MHEYLGDLKGEENLGIETVKEGYRNASIPGSFLFFKKYKAYPCVLEPYYNETVYISATNALKILKEEFNHDFINDVKHYHRCMKNDYKFITNLICDIGNGVMVQLTSGSLVDNLDSTAKIEYAVNKFHHIFYGYRIYFLPYAEELADKISHMLESVKFKHSSEASLQMICKNQCGFYLTSIKIKKPIITDLKLHYGEEFEKVHDTIVNALKSENSHGLILLHGLPGSGKTHYIRYLIQEFTDKKLIYIPPDMTSSISTPEFFPFMLQQKDSILIIEDAENIIKSRDSSATTTQSVANLLNLSDGLLGDSLHQPIIATFNCELNSIDTALLRKGRLITQYEFGKLSIENSQKLSNELGFKTTITEPLTLADIYGQEK